MMAFSSSAAAAKSNAILRNSPAYTSAGFKESHPRTTINASLWVRLSPCTLPHLFCNCHSPQISLAHKCTAAAAPTSNASHLSSITAQSSIEYIPEANFYKVEAILRPWRVPQVSSAMLEMGIRGVTVSDVRGFGAQGGLTERQAGSEFSEDKFVAKVKMEIVVRKDQVEAVIEKIIEEARTAEIGDGKIFVVPVADVIRVRTGERGEKAERMMGGRADMFSPDSPA